MLDDDTMTLIKFDNFQWSPENLAEWGGSWDATCQCEPGTWAEARECSSGCEYTEWSNWLRDMNGQTCFPKYENGDWARWDWMTTPGANKPNSCVKSGEDRSGVMWRNRERRCGPEDVCCGLEHTGPCEMPVCSGWKEWGSWSEWSMKCGANTDHKRTRGRTRDCRGMDGRIGSDSCPCNANFATTECPFTVGNDDTCPNHFTSQAGWAARVLNNDHDDDDSGYLQIVEENIKICPYLRLACQGENWDKTQMWDQDNAACDENELWWSQWSDCSTSCGDGIQSRHRECLDGSAEPDQDELLGMVSGCRHGIVREVRYCETSDERPAVCPHQRWSEWTDCSATCGGGSQTRHRECFSNGEEISCFGTVTTNDIVQDVVPIGFLSYAAWQESTAESRTCRQIACPRLSSWVMVEDCSGECADDNGVKKMVRECLRGSADSDGCNCDEIDGNTVCSGHNEADEVVTDGRGLVWFEPCNRDRCPMWSDWANWSNCEVEDDVSAIRRKRSCMVFNAETDAFEENSDSIGHRHCREGDHVEAVDCYEEECPAV